MSNAALTIWISCGSLLVAAASLFVSVAAYRRSETFRRRLDRLSELSRDIAALRPRLDQLERTIPKALPSRAREPDRLSELCRDIAALRPRLEQLERAIPKAVQARAPAPAPLGPGLPAGVQAATAREPSGPLQAAVPTPKRADYAGIETKSATARQASTRLEQLVHYMRERGGRPR